MKQGSMCCKVFFEKAFWVMVIEQKEARGQWVSRTVFGSEPSDQEVYAFLCEHFDTLDFRPIELEFESIVKINSKRKERIVQKQMKQPLVSTKAQMAMKQIQEEQQKEKKADHRAYLAQQKEQKFLQKQQKRKLKHRGR